jgi:hypothetical protein
MAGANKAAAHGSNVEEDEDMREALKNGLKFCLSITRYIYRWRVFYCRPGKHAYEEMATRVTSPLLHCCL